MPLSGLDRPTAREHSPGVLTLIVGTNRPGSNTRRVASVVAGLTLIAGIVCLAFYWEEIKGSAASKGDALNSPPLERTEGGDWPTAHGDGSGGAHH